MLILGILREEGSDKRRGRAKAPSQPCQEGARHIHTHTHLCSWAFSSCVLENARQEIGATGQIFILADFPPKASPDLPWLDWLPAEHGAPRPPRSIPSRNDEMCVRWKSKQTAACQMFATPAQEHGAHGSSCCSRGTSKPGLEKLPIPTFDRVPPFPLNHISSATS